MKDKDGLTPKQARFCVEYLKDHNGTQAAMRAGFSLRTAAKQAPQLLARTSVRSKIEQGDAKIAKKCELDAVEVLRESKRIMFSDIDQLLDENGDWKPIKIWPEDARRAVASVERDRRGKIKITFWSKDRALEHGLKMTGQLKEHVVVEQEPMSPDEIDRIWGGRADKKP
jgi:phage terminase small subunit